ncbi:hypothetical protein [Haladaptatus sp. ZSTT2]|uniref:hypothetical protein n=1 Tax=Haladaptatus sp. ZSTT2 TaxID=3120515 RepID=UPI00300F31B9
MASQSHIQRCMEEAHDFSRGSMTGILLVKGTTLGLAVLAMIAFMVRDGQPVVLPQVVIFAVLGLLGLVLVVRFLRAIEPTSVARRDTAESMTSRGDPR